MLVSNCAYPRLCPHATFLHLISSHVVHLRDLNMPIMSGWEATAQLRQLGFTMPIVALTANALDESRRRCMEMGFTAFLTKPFKRAELQALLKRFCSFDTTSQ